MEKIEFYSQGEKIIGNLYGDLNAEDKKPAIILCHGFAGVKELLLPNFAQKFSKNGYIVLTFDYRGFGESEGTRSSILPFRQVEDIRAAISFMASLKVVDADRIALWGTSLGGANVLDVISRDKRVKAATVQITFGNGLRNNSSHLDEAGVAKLNKSLDKAYTNMVVKNKVLSMPLKKILSDEQSVEFFNNYIEDFPDALSVKIPFVTTKYINEFIPEDRFNFIDIPVLVVGANNDIVNNPEESIKIYQNLNTTKELMMVDANHYDIYVGDKFEEVSDKQLSWFNQYL